jgi:molybdopterin converting factor small subunit
MPKVTIRLPAVLAQTIGGERRIEVDGDDLQGALMDLVQLRPVLGLHIFDEVGVMRRHVRCFCNDKYASSRDDFTAPLRSGDTITILNSVAGG